jgi:hypothetical protein
MVLRDLLAWVERWWGWVVVRGLGELLAWVER